MDKFKRIQALNSEMTLYVGFKIPKLKISYFAFRLPTSRLVDQKFIQRIKNLPFQIDLPLILIRKVHRKKADKASLKRSFKNFLCQCQIQSQDNFLLMGLVHGEMIIQYFCQRTIFK